MSHASAATELVDAVKAIGAVEKLTALSEGIGNPAQLTAVRGRLIRKALHAAVVAARFTLPPPVVREEPALQHDLAEHVRLAEPQPDTRTLREARQEFERDWLAARVADHNGNISAAAGAVGMDVSALNRKFHGLGLRAQRDPSRPIFKRRKPKV